MNFWTIVIYGIAAVIALQGLLALMVAHRQASLNRFFQEESRRSELQAAEKSEPTAMPNGQKSKAA